MAGCQNGLTTPHTLLVTRTTLSTALSFSAHYKRYDIQIGMQLHKAHYY